jgi:hypothetical protein
MNSKLYKLEAHTAEQSKWVYITAYDDMNAQMDAVTYVLDEAVRHYVWAKGAIKLTSPDGRVVAEMGAK